MLGFAFEGLDGVGRRRTTDRRGHPVDVSGLKIRNDAGDEVTFNGPKELAAVLTDISVVQRCVGQKWLTFALQQALPGGGDAVPTNDGQLDGVQAAFKASGLDIRALIAAVVQTQAFLASAGGNPDGGADAGAGDASTDIGPLPEGCAMAPTILVACTGCHNAQAAPAFGGLDMATPGWEKKLVGAPPAAGAPGTNACNKSLNYLNRTQPATGLFLDKLKATPPCGAQMPLATVAAPLSATEMACVQKWANNVVAGGTGQ
ncbi:MAG TPA: DUF1585 domain-containing protein [Polyangia bacterium]|jgi:hypothetical protein|nr:DUF1585 domain-containing protein [Polyangia bacterium]